MSGGSLRRDQEPSQEHTEIKSNPSLRRVIAASIVAAAAVGCEKSVFPAHMTSPTCRHFDKGEAGWNGTDHDNHTSVKMGPVKSCQKCLRPVSNAFDRVPLLQMHCNLLHLGVVFTVPNGRLSASLVLRITQQNLEQNCLSHLSPGLADAFYSERLI
ncbi:hypothetical protein EDB83DRAFT_1946664 [Lactarius deliciosus]|nr:hypothetical protein EDB83DRAFT_1946664 [Lactarius deliciosus]